MIALLRFAGYSYNPFSGGFNRVAHATTSVVFILFLA